MPTRSREIDQFYLSIQLFPFLDAHLTTQAFNCQLLGRRTANVEVFGANWPPVSFAPEGQTVVAGQYRGANRALIQE